MQIAKVRLLNQHSAENPLHLQFLVVIEAALRQEQQEQVFLGSENFPRAIGEAGSNDAFDEKLRYFLRGQRVHDVVERQHAAERRNRVAGERLRVSVEQRGLLGGAAGIVVLDDDGGGPFEFGDQAAGGFEVDVIVIGKLLALKLFRGSESRGGMAGRDVQSRGLGG